MDSPGVVQDIGDVSGLLGLLLLLVTLFTSEQARDLDREETRRGGPRRRSVGRISIIAGILAVVTTVGLVGLTPLAVDVLDTCCRGRWQPVLFVFLLVWLLLIALVAWQMLILVRSRRTIHRK